MSDDRKLRASLDESEAPPSEATCIAMYGALGAVASFLFGHTPGTIPDNIMAELCPSIIIICIFFILYEVYDVMGCGVVKQKQINLLMIFYSSVSHPQNHPFMSSVVVKQYITPDGLPLWESTASAAYLIQQESTEERGHALQLIDFANKRNIPIKSNDIKKGGDEISIRLPLLLRVLMG
eukprot:828076_1